MGVYSFPHQKKKKKKPSREETKGLFMQQIPTPLAFKFKLEQLPASCWHTKW